MNPSMVGSMTIVVPGLERVIVAFPATLDSDVVIVCDVLVAVYRAMQESAFEHRGGFGAKRGIEGRRNLLASAQADLMANTYTPAIEELGEDHWWAGLDPHQNERDVWVLRTKDRSAMNASTVKPSLHSPPPQGL